MDLLNRKTPTNRVKTPIDHDVEDIARRTKKAIDDTNIRLDDIRASLIRLSDEQERLEAYRDNLREFKSIMK
mgnify:FL=1